MLNYKDQISAAKWLEHYNAANTLSETAKKELDSLESQRPHFSYIDKDGKRAETTIQLHPNGEFVYFPDRIVTIQSMPQFIMWLCHVFGTPPELLNQKVDKETPEE
jgi:hypothetical protein